MHRKSELEVDKLSEAGQVSHVESRNAPGPGWARWRAPLGYPVAALCLWLARPTFISILIGSVVAVFGLLIRGAAAGHLRKREALAHTGLYARTRNPLYFGSALIAAGFVLASRSWRYTGPLRVRSGRMRSILKTSAPSATSRPSHTP